MKDNSNSHSNSDLNSKLNVWPRNTLSSCGDLQTVPSRTKCPHNSSIVYNNVPVDIVIPGTIPYTPIHVSINCKVKSSHFRCFLVTYVIMRVSSPGSPSTPSTNRGVFVKLYLFHCRPSSRLNLGKHKQPLHRGTALILPHLDAPTHRPCVQANDPEWRLASLFHIHCRADVL